MKQLRSRPGHLRTPRRFLPGAPALMPAQTPTECHFCPDRRSWGLGESLLRLPRYPDNPRQAGCRAAPVLRTRMRVRQCAPQAARRISRDESPPPRHPGLALWRRCHRPHGEGVPQRPDSLHPDPGRPRVHRRTHRQVAHGPRRNRSGGFFLLVDRARRSSFRHPSPSGLCRAEATRSIAGPRSQA